MHVIPRSCQHVCTGQISQCRIRRSSPHNAHSCPEDLLRAPSQGGLLIMHSQQAKLQFMFASVHASNKVYPQRIKPARSTFGLFIQYRGPFSFLQHYVTSESLCTVGVTHSTLFLVFVVRGTHEGGNLLDSCARQSRR